MPRDIPFLAKMADKYTLTSFIEKNKYYYGSKKVTLSNSDKLKKEEDETYAGLKDNQQTVYCSLNPGEKYFYTIVAVNERRQFQKPAKIIAGSPRPNAPEPATAFHSVVLQDLRELRFEWELPLYNSDIYHIVFTKHLFYHLRSGIRFAPS